MSREILAVLTLMLLCAPAAVRAAGPDACALLSRDEIAAATGRKVQGFERAHEEGGISVCAGRAGEASLTLRAAGKADAEAATGQRALDRLRGKGAKVELTRAGTATCVRVTTQQTMSSASGRAFCAAPAGDRAAILETEAPSVIDLIPPATLGALAERAAARL